MFRGRGASASGLGLAILREIRGGSAFRAALRPWVTAGARLGLEPGLSVTGMDRQPRPRMQGPAWCLAGKLAGLQQTAQPLDGFFFFFLPK